MFANQVGYVYLNKQFVGELSRTGSTYRFQYDNKYVSDANNTPLSCSLPLRASEYMDEYLFPFFEGLLSEGWLRKQQEQLQKLDERDSFTRLLKNGAHLIGAVRVLEQKL